MPSSHYPEDIISFWKAATLLVFSTSAAEDRKFWLVFLETQRKQNRQEEIMKLH